MYKSLSARPKILHGSSPQKIPLHHGLSNSIQSTSPSKGRTKFAVSHHGRSSKNEDLLKTTYSSCDELNKYLNSKNLFGSGSKFGKEQSTKSQKISTSKVSHKLQLLEEFSV